MSTIIDLGKLRFSFRNNYSATAQYEYNDVVIFGGDVFVFINNVASIGTDPTNATHWAKMVGGLNATGAWSGATNYFISDLVTHGGSLYRATAPNLNQEPPNGAFWELLAGGLNFRGTWATATAYEANDSVVYEGQSYRALTNHTSSAAFLTDLAAGDWERYAAGSNNRGAYLNSTDYFKGDLVQTGTAPNLNHYLCLTDHTSDAVADPSGAPENTNWTLLIAGTYTTSNADRQYAYFVAVGT